MYNKSDFAKPLLSLKSLWIWKFIYIYGNNYQDISFKIYNLMKIIMYEILVRMKRKRDWLYLQDIHFKIYSNEEKKLLLKILWYNKNYGLSKLKEKSKNL